MEEQETAATALKHPIDMLYHQGLAVREGFFKKSPSRCVICYSLQKNLVISSVFHSDLIPSIYLFFLCMDLYCSVMSFVFFGISKGEQPVTEPSF